MKKLIYTIISIWLCSAQHAAAQQHIAGTVSNAEGEPLAGAVLHIVETNTSVHSNQQGSFSITTPLQKITLRASHLGYAARELSLTVPYPQQLQITLQEDPRQLQEVQVSTGYQQLSRERATGSFEQLGRELLDRSVGSSIIDRLDGLSGVTLFDKRNFNINTSSSPQLTVRGINTINAGTAPLIVLDNFPYEGNISDINPNDIAGITILKDAAAASIWGASAGNGVIVITTKKGSYNQPMKFSFNSSLNITGKPQLYKFPELSSTEYVDLERNLFARGYYTSLENNNRRPALSPVVELLIAHRDGQLGVTDLETQLAQLGAQDVRDDYLSRVYREATHQQYAFNARGGGSRHTYYLSAGYDKNLFALKSNAADRISLRMENSFRPVEKLELRGSLQYTDSRNERMSSSSAMGYGQLRAGSRRLYPYARLQDDTGMPAVIDKDYRSSYIHGIGNGLLLDWDYRPLEELSLADNTVSGSSLLAAASVSYQPKKWMKAELRYQYQRGSSNERDHFHPNSYYARNLINLYSSVSGNQITRPIPLGGILDESNSLLAAHGLRGQLNLGHSWGGRHELNGIAGAELRQVNSRYSGNRTYGYDDNLLTYINVNYTAVYPAYNNLASAAAIPNSAGFGNTLNRYVSVFTNAAYSYDRRYTLSASVRKDASNLFGVTTNQKGVPLWSAGLAWDIARESFYKLDALPHLKLRASLGYAGNVDNNRSAYTTMRYYTEPDGISNLPYAYVQNPPNARLRWEKVRTLNIGIDFSLLNRILSGSIDSYRKKSTDLLGAEDADPTSGFTSTTLNGAASRGQGWELQLNSTNLDKALGWTTQLSIAYSKSKIASYSYTSYANQMVGNGNALNPLEGYMVYPLFSYRWSGLDPQTGDPVGYFGGEESKNYSDIVNNAELGDLVYHGSAIPLYNGSLRNTFNYKGFTASANITFRFDYWFRRSTVNYGSLYANGAGHPDYVLRWQQPGDELQTQVPAMVYPAIANRDAFYTNSELLVEKGDHIRLHDIRLSYDLQQPKLGKLQLFAYATNLGILWRANKHNIDPDYGFNGIPPSRSIALGLRADF